MFLKILKYTSYSILIPSGFYVGYYSIMAHLNHSKAETMKKDIQAIMDSTRPDYEFFGINWGASADQGIMDELDTGDFLFATVDCQKMMSFNDIFQCHLNRLSRMETHREADVMGILIRNAEHLYVISNGTNGIKIQTYPEFLQNSYQK